MTSSRGKAAAEQEMGRLSSRVPQMAGPQDADGGALSALQRLTHHPHWMLVWMCWAGAVQGVVVNGFVNTSITSIERRFGLSSTTTGLLGGVYDITCLFVVVPFSYFGSKPSASKPRWLATGLFVLGLGSFVFLLPHFLAGPYEVLHGVSAEDSRVHLCGSSVASDPSCGEESGSGSLSNYKYVFFLGQVLHGLGAAHLYTLGTAFIDESVSATTSPLYVGIFFSMAVVGPAFGYGLGGVFLQNYVDVGVDPELLGITPSSQRWVGAWWIGFIISGSLAVLVSIPIFMTPAVIPRKKEKQEKNSSGAVVEDDIAGAEVAGAHAFDTFEGFVPSARALLTNAPYLALSVAESTEGFVMAGIASFMPKIIERQFSMSSSSAAMLVGAIAIPAGGGGTFLGGWLIKRFRMGQRAVLRLCLGLAVACIAFTFGFAMYCPNTFFAGINFPYDDGYPNSSALTSSCNVGCRCEDVAFNPVCVANGVMYFSACHAGCSSGQILNGSQVYGDCGCVSGKSLLPGLAPQQAAADSCASDCGLLVPFGALMMVFVFITFLVSMPNVSATLRSVNPKDRGLALAIQNIMLRILGSIPGSVLFGVVIDQACVLLRSSCGEDGACAAYDNKLMNWYLLGLMLSAKVVSALAFLVALRTHKPPPDARPGPPPSVGGSDNFALDPS